MPEKRSACRLRPFIWRFLSQPCKVSPRVCHLAATKLLLLNCRHINRDLTSCSHSYCLVLISDSIYSASTTRTRREMIGALAVAAMAVRDIDAASQISSIAHYTIAVSLIGYQWSSYMGIHTCTTPALLACIFISNSHLLVQKTSKPIERATPST
eukprot:6212403-Pleurochrysis_carterae.AAC.2